MIPLFCAKTVNADFDLITPLQRVVESHWYVLGQEIGPGDGVSVGDDYVAHLYVVRTPQRDALAKHLKALGVATDVHYPLADTEQPAYPNQTPLPISQTACDQVLSLPCYPGMTQAQVDTVIDAVKTFFISDVCFR